MANDRKGRLCFQKRLSVHREGSASKGVLSPGGSTSKGEILPTQPRTKIYWRPLQRSERILLECILFINFKLVLTCQSKIQFILPPFSAQCFDVCNFMVTSAWYMIHSIIIFRLSLCNRRWSGGPWADVWWTCSDHLLLLQVWKVYLLLDTVTDTVTSKTSETDLRFSVRTWCEFCAVLCPRFSHPMLRNKYKWEKI